MTAAGSPAPHPGTIAQISFKYLPVRGGQEVYIQNLQRILAEQGFQGRVYQPNWGTRGPDAVLVPRLPLVGRFIPSAAHFAFLWALQWGYQARLRQADALIVHYPFFAPAAWQMARRTIILSHGIEWYPEGTSAYDRASERLGRVAIERFTVVANDTHFLRHFGLSAPPGQGFFQPLAQQPNCWFIPNCIDSTHFRPVEALPALQQQSIILVPRQVTPDRGIDLAIRAFANFNQVRPGCTLLILGPVPKGERRYQAACQALAGELGLSAQVRFQPAVPNADMPVWYSSARLTLIPTLRREGTSLSALESMACAAPTVSTAVAGLRDLPALQAAPQPEALAAAMLEAFQAGRSLGEEQMQAVRHTFNLDNWRSAWLRVIKTCMIG